MLDQINIPNPGFDTLQLGILKVATDNATDFEIPSKVILLLTSNSTSWGVYYGVSKFKKTANQVDNENTAAMKSKFIEFLRPFLKQYFYDNPLVSDADIIKAGLQPHSRALERSNIISEEIPTVKAEPKPAHAMNYTCLNAAGKKSKPKKIVFFRVKYHVGANAPTDPVMFTRFKDFSAHPIQITFDAADAGKPLAYAVCYVTNKGPEAPFTNIITTTVP